MRNQILTSPELATSVLWRVIGDEMVFVLPIQMGLELPEKIDAIFDVVQRISISLQRGVFFDGLVGQTITKTDISMMKSQNILSMKATAWIALINDTVEVPYESINVSYYAADNKQIITDYLGQDIDTGFRLKSYTQDRRLVISYELAYLLNQKGKSDSMHIMDYVRLKGVWGESLYPVIWYHNDDALAILIGDKTAAQFAHSFRYDETDHNDLVNAYFKRGRNKKKKMNAVVDEDYLLADSMFDIKTAVNKICVDRNLDDKMRYLSEILDKPIFISNSPTVITPLQVHCAVVCCDVISRKIMITRRTNNHNTNPNKWEFGCVKLQSNMSVIDSAKSYYRDTYGIEIELICDLSREEKQPIPIALYEIGSTDNIKKGIITVGKVKGDILKDFRADKEHQAVEWISEEQIGEYASEAVADFEDTIRTVFKRFDEFFENKEEEMV